MTELSQTERMALRRIINLLPAIEKQFGVGEYLDDDKIIKYVQPPKPQPVATLCEAAQRLSDYLDSHNTDNSYALMLARNAVKDALTAERKRAVLVKELIIASRAIAQFNTEDHGIRFPRVRCALDALDAFDKGVNNE